MARPKGRPKTKPENAPPAVRPTVINMKGSQEEVDWLEAVHRRTRLAKVVIMRIALEQWAANTGQPPYPTPKDDA